MQHGHYWPPWSAATGKNKGRELISWKRVRRENETGASTHIGHEVLVAGKSYLNYDDNYDDDDDDADDGNDDVVEDNDDDDVRTSPKMSVLPPNISENGGGSMPLS